MAQAEPKLRKADTKVRKSVMAKLDHQDTEKMAAGYKEAIGQKKTTS